MATTCSSFKGWKDCIFSPSFVSSTFTETAWIDFTETFLLFFSKQFVLIPSIINKGVLYFYNYSLYTCCYHWNLFLSFFSPCYHDALWYLQFVFNFLTFAIHFCFVKTSVFFWRGIVHLQRLQRLPSYNLSNSQNAPHFSTWSLK